MTVFRSLGAPFGGSVVAAPGVPLGALVGAPLGAASGALVVAAFGALFGVRRQPAFALAGGSPDPLGARDLSVRAARGDFVAPGGGSRREAPARPHARAEWLENRLTERDWAILETLFRVRLATSGQIQRLHFFGLSQAASIRKRTLKRLTEWRAIIAPVRRIGGPSGGSQQRIYSLDPAAQQLMELRWGIDPQRRRSADPTVSPRLATHMLTVAELYVRCVEMSRSGALDLLEFQVEPDCWWPLQTGDYLKPDAYLCIGVPGSDFVDHWWIEIDLGTIRAPHMRRKFARYADFAANGGTGPGGVLPGIVVTAPHDTRRTGLKQIVTRLGTTARQLIQVIPFDSAVTVLASHAANLPNPSTERHDQS